MQRKFQREIAVLEEIHAFAAEFLGGAGVDPSHQYAVDFAIEELFTNMVKYNPGNTHEITIALDREGDRLLIRLTDVDVDAFDPTKAPEVDVSRPAKEREPGGLGLHLVKKLFDEIRYEYKDRISRITLTKNLR